MDLPLSARVLTAPPDPTIGGGVVSFSGATASELARAAIDVLEAYGDPAVVPTAGGTPATCIRGMTLAASRGGLFVCELQIEPDEAFIQSGPTAPYDQQFPINATVGTFAGLGYAGVQFLEVSSPSELARTDDWAVNFWQSEAARTGFTAAFPYLYEVQFAGNEGGRMVTALLWAFTPTEAV